MVAGLLNNTKTGITVVKTRLRIGLRSGSTYLLLILLRLLTLNFLGRTRLLFLKSVRLEIIFLLTMRLLFFLVVSGFFGKGKMRQVKKKLKEKLLRTT